MEGAAESKPYTVFNPTQKTLLLYACSISAIFSTISSLRNTVAPSIFGTLADDIGRRPVLLFTLALYLGANVGLALTKHCVALVVLRCVQSAGASSTIAIAYGIIADISVPSDRGSFVGVLLGFTHAAPCLGSVIGGVVSENRSWRWIFWLLAIASGTHLVMLTIFLPETSRKLVGNGNIRPTHRINHSLYAMLHRQSPSEEPIRTPMSFDFLGPFKSLKTLYNKANFIAILVGGITYTIFGCLLAKTHNILPGFPIEKTRLRSIFPVIATSSIATVGYGWTLHASPHITVLLTLLTDLNPDRSSTAQASYSLIRCLLSAGGIAAVEAMIQGMGVGWCFTAFAVFGALCVPLLCVKEERKELALGRRRGYR
ncbi:MFS general substrate transporter [Mytilinidion resinicola]|uniref:MFS general substrate transporter n=1 Tax=Mytilinidion resinicola TaxID=574789 RepID=A0A6A6YUR7_9PEZI|nr:MFS general substrate transporter [Mytilinidion resinicola]KAF2812123.1 MFS general substrate transporter [Mytilinidion resinicola]